MQPQLISKLVVSSLALLVIKINEYNGFMLKTMNYLQNNAGNYRVLSGKRRNGGYFLNFFAVF